MFPLSLIYLATAILAGLVFVKRFLPDLPPMVRLGGGLFVGIVIAAWVTFLTAWALSNATDDSRVIGMIVSLAVSGAVVGLYRRHLNLGEFRFNLFEMGLILGSLLLSFWLMDARLSGDPLMVSRETWGDTALHVSLAKSFSAGANFPPEYPFFGDATIRYHFGYDFFAGALDKGGLPVLWAFNLPGALGFTAMMLIVYQFGKHLFGSVAVGLIAVILLITNASWAFLEFFQFYGWDTLTAISIDGSFPFISWGFADVLWDHEGYLAVGPYFFGGEVDTVSIFWTLNVFLTQTHLIVAMAGALFVSFSLVKTLRDGEQLTTQRALFLGTIVGAGFWLNGVLYIAAMTFFLALFYVFGPWRRSLPYLPAVVAVLAALVIGGSVIDDVLYKVALVWVLGSLAVLGRLRESWAFLVPAGLIALPQAIWLNGGLDTGGDSLQFHTGYLVENFSFLRPESYWDFGFYWFLNLGFALPLMVLAALWVTKADKKLMAAVMAIFIFGNFVQLSRDLGGHNHKIFNFWEILMNLFVAYAFVRLWNAARDNLTLGSFTLPKQDVNLLLRVVVVPVVFVVLVLSGVIDFMTVKNDGKPEAMFTVFDKPEAIEWVEDNTPGEARFLTAYGDLYTTPALAGRRLYLGYEPWVSSAGYEIAPRIQTIGEIYNAPSKEEACRLLVEHNLDYVQLGPQERNAAGSGRFQLNESMWAGNFTPVYTGQFNDGELFYYDVSESCAGNVSRAPLTSRG
ncbi:MAG: hypothetical protein ACE5FA_02430 [Dehalococcoidia bacterium]